METVRDGQKVWPYCPECGCRLSITADQDDWPVVEHFGYSVYSIADKPVDARGHECSLVGQGWVTNPESLAHVLLPQ